VAGAPEIVGALFGFAVTVMLNGGSETMLVPSETEIEMLEYVFAEPTGGVPLRRPELATNEAHDGRFAMLNVSRFPSGSLAVGRKPYVSPSTAADDGLPPIVGGLFVGGVGAGTGDGVGVGTGTMGWLAAAETTVTVKRGRLSTDWPSLTEMRIPYDLPR
jgi:hypothetical protein